MLRRSMHLSKPAQALSPFFKLIDPEQEKILEEIFVCLNL
jgi:hypothetical protein